MLTSYQYQDDRTMYKFPWLREGYHPKGDVLIQWQYIQVDCRVVIGNQDQYRRKFHCRPSDFACSQVQAWYKWDAGSFGVIPCELTKFWRNYSKFLKYKKHIHGKISMRFIQNNSKSCVTFWTKSDPYLHFTKLQNQKTTPLQKLWQHVVLGLDIKYVALSIHNMRYPVPRRKS